MDLTDNGPLMLPWEQLALHVAEFCLILTCNDCAITYLSIHPFCMMFCHLSLILTTLDSYNIETKKDIKER